MTNSQSNLLANLPLLDLASATETGAHANLDWPLAKHDSSASQVNSQTLGIRTWKVDQSLESAGGIQKLIDSGQAVYAVEARCLFTAWCELFLGDTNSNQVTVNAPENMTRGNVFLCPGVLTLEDCELETEDLHPIQRPADGAPISVPAGYWLVLGRPLPVQSSERDSMVFFVVDESLQDKQMRIASDNQVDDVRFKVSLSKKAHSQIMNDSALRWGCHLAAMAMLPYTEEYEVEEIDGVPSVPGSSIGQRLADQLHAVDIPLWDIKEDWDPALALCALLEIPAPSSNLYENEDEDEG